MERGRTSVLLRPSGRGPPDATICRSVLVASFWKASCTSASSSAARGAACALDLSALCGGASPVSAAGVSATAVVSSDSTLACSASNAASRCCLERTERTFSSSPSHMRSTSAATFSGMTRIRWFAFGLPTASCHAPTALQMSRTASWPNAHASTISASGTNLQKPSIIRMALAVPATTRVTSDFACSSIGAFSFHAPSSLRVTRTQATGEAKGTSEIESAAAEAHTAMQSGGELPS
mmetsp:Transcript_9388/g.23754  ORF Transcript_9388/g.23754 Transcript_9388/m.23754 type:complete len:237 (-) Transcript_9388:604-1314(-)